MAQQPGPSRVQVREAGQIGAHRQTAARPRSALQREPLQTSRTPKRKASSSDQRAPSTRPRMQRRRARRPPVTPSRRPRKNSRLRSSRRERDLRESLRVLPSLKRTRGFPASTCRVAVLGAQRPRVSARRPRTSGCSPSGPGKLPNRCASQAKRSARVVRPEVQVRHRGRPGGAYESPAIKGWLIGNCSNAARGRLVGLGSSSSRPVPRVVRRWPLVGPAGASEFPWPTEIPDTESAHG